MSDERQSPPRKRARLTSPSPPTEAREDATADVETASNETPFASQAGVVSEAPIAQTEPQQQVEAPAPALGSALPSPAWLALVNPLVAPATVATLTASAALPTPEADAEMESAEVASATVMLSAQAEEAASSTDDEELQQLSMVNADPKVVVDILSGDSGAEVQFDDLLNTVFQAAKEGKLPSILQCFKLIKRSDNAGELMKRAVAAEDETGLTLLMVCVRNNLLPLTSFLLHEGADVNHCNVRIMYGGWWDSDLSGKWVGRT